MYFRKSLDHAEARSRSIITTAVPTNVKNSYTVDAKEIKTTLKIRNLVNKGAGNPPTLLLQLSRQQRLQLRVILEVQRALKCQMLARVQMMSQHFIMTRVQGSVRPSFTAVAAGITIDSKRKNSVNVSVEDSGDKVPTMNNETFPLLISNSYFNF